jgi:hypothetical protein
MLRVLAVLATLGALIAPLGAGADSFGPAQGRTAWTRIVDAPAGMAVQHPRSWSARLQAQTPVVVVASYPLAAAAASAPEPRRPMPPDSAFVAVYTIPVRLMLPRRRRTYPARPLQLSWMAATGATIEGFGPGASFRFRANGYGVTAQVAFGPGATVRTRAQALRVVASLQLTPLRLREQTIRVGGAPTGIAFARGSAWVALATALVRIDGATGRVERRIAVPAGGDYRHVSIAGDDAWLTDGAGRRASIVDVDLAAGRVRRVVPIECCAIGVAARGNDVWVTVPRDGPGEVVRLDARTGRIVARIPVGNGPGPIAIAGSRVWVWNTSAPTSLLAIDPHTNRVAGGAALHGVSDLAAGAAGLWAGGDSIGLVQIDPRNGRILRRTSAVSGARSVAVGDRAVYASQTVCGVCTESFVTRTGIAAGLSGAAVPAGKVAVDLAVGAGALWVADVGGGTVTRIPVQNA